MKESNYKLFPSPPPPPPVWSLGVHYTKSPNTNTAKTIQVPSPQNKLTATLVLKIAEEINRATPTDLKKKYFECDYKWLMLTSQTLQKSFSLVNKKHFLPIMSTILPCLLTLTCIKQNNSPFFHFILPISLFMHQVPPTHSQKGSATER